MSTKIVLTLTLIAGSSFTAWDLFPVQEQGKGKAKVGLVYNFHDERDVI